MQLPGQSNGTPAHRGAAPSSKHCAGVPQRREWGHHLKLACGEEGVMTMENDILQELLAAWVLHPRVVL